MENGAAFQDGGITEDVHDEVQFFPQVSGDEVSTTEEVCSLMHDGYEVSCCSSAV